MKFLIAQCPNCANVLNEFGICSFCASVEKYQPKKKSIINRPYSEKFYLGLFVAMFIIYCLVARFW